MKSLRAHLFKCIMIIACTLAAFKASAQMENAGIMIPKNYLCPGVMYSNSNWSYYWEGAYKRNNGNIGTVNTSMYSLMVTYGITNNLSATDSLPYITSRASAGTLHNQTGLQNLALNIKWKGIR